MKRESNYFNSTRFAKTGLKLLLTFSFTLLFSFILAKEQSSSFLFAGNPGYGKESKINVGLSHLPQGASLVTDDLEAQDEDELNDYDHSLTAATGLNSSLGFNILLEKSFSVIPSHFTHGRFTVPFFILFHSWKSFLS